MLCDMMIGDALLLLHVLIGSGWEDASLLDVGLWQWFKVLLQVVNEVNATLLCAQLCLKKLSGTTMLMKVLIWHKLVVGYASQP